MIKLKGFNEHITSVVCEWLTLILVSTLVITFFSDFKRCKLIITTSVPQNEQANQVDLGQRSNVSFFLLDNSTLSMF